VKLRLSSSKLTSDFPISDLQIMQWLRIARDKIVTSYLEISLQRDNHVPGELIEVVKTGTPSSVDEGITVYELALGANVEFLSIKDNKQLTSAVIIDTTADTQVKARVVDFQELENIRIMEFTKPTAAHPICYIRGTSVWFEGIAASSTATVYGVKAYTDLTVDVADMQFIGSQAGDIAEMATKLGLFELRPELYDTINDGKILTIKHTR